MSRSLITALSATACQSHLSSVSLLRGALLLILSATLAACVSTPVTAPSTESSKTAPTPHVTTVAAYEQTTFDALPAVTVDDWRAMWPAFLQSCRALGKRDAWRAACAAAPQVDAIDGTAVQTFFATRFDAYRIFSREMADGRQMDSHDSGLMTGYYEPLLHGSRTRSATYAYPIYRVPDDLLVIDLAGEYPELANLRLRGKLQGRRVVPYPARADIAAGNVLAGNELLWVDDAIEAFFLQIQGSGRVELDDGRVLRVGYGDQNGRPYKSIGRWLVDQGELTLDQASMQNIKGWATRNPARVNELLDQNPSYVFFREIPIGDPHNGPVGALGIPLTPGYSLAADARYVPLGAPLIIATTDPLTHAPLRRAMLAQDSGGAIRGPLRFDFFWGFGSEAGEMAGKQKYEASAWVLVPRGTTPEALLKR